MMQLVIYAAHGYRFGGYEYSIFMDYITVTVMTPFQQHVEHPLTHASWHKSALPSGAREKY
jgi:hypothetical protein